MFQMFESSAKAKNKITSYEDKIGVDGDFALQTVYPLGKLSIGWSLAIPFADATEATMRAVASQRSKKLKKKFCVIKWKDAQFYEIARVE